MKNLTFFFLVTSHIFFGILLIKYPIFATIHAWLTVILGITILILNNNQKTGIYIGAYIVGSEIIWRMVGASTFWEMGKYALVIVFVVSLLKKVPWKNFMFPLVYFLLLVVSIPLTFDRLGFSEAARQAISFNLSGPLSLAVSIIFFRQQKIDEQDICKIAWFIAFPIITILTIAVGKSLTAEQIVFFSTRSNFITSGGFGPNQVSAILGLGATLLVLFLIYSKNTFQKYISLIFLFLFIIQASLTFSRGGIYNFAFSLMFIALHLLIDNKKVGFTLLIFGLLLFLTFYLFTNINELTGGMLGDRFLSLDSSGRVEILKSEINIWKKNPIFGVGPGIGAYDTSMYYGIYASAHTEYSRLLSDHGIFGLLSLLILSILTIKAYFDTSNWNSKLIVATLLVWPITEMTHAAMRIVAISFIFGLANAKWGPTLPDSMPKITNPLKNREKKLIE